MIFLLLLSGIAIAAAEEVRIAAGYTFIKAVFNPIRSAFRDKTGIDITIVYNDPAPALAELEKGVVDAAGASLPLEQWLELADKNGMPVKKAGVYNSHVAISEKLMIMVHVQNRVKGLSKEQLRGIFSGRIRNWKEVGGDDAPVLVVWPTLSSGALITFKDIIMGTASITKTVYDVESIADTPDAIAVTPEAIGVVTGPGIPKGLKEIAPAMERPLTLLYKGKPTPNLQKLLDFLNGEGKQYLK